jgi:phosphatidylglycerol:prolipoprotein diacylglycerol transferase
MHPVILGLPAWGLLMGLGVLTVYLLAGRLARREGFHKDLVVDMTLIAVFGGAIGCRAMHVFEYWDVYSAAPWHEMLRVDKGGMSWYGSFFTILPASWVYCRRKGVGFLAFVDLGTIFIPIGQLFGRVGCFLAGCCWGRQVPADAALAPFAVRFPVGSPPWAAHVSELLGVEHMSLQQLQAAYAGLPPGLQEGSYAVLPVQLLMALAGALITGFFLWYYGRHRRHGQAFAATFTWLALSRFGFEFLRADNPMIGALSQHQWISLASVGAGVALWLALARWGAVYAPASGQPPAPAEATGPAAGRAVGA